MRDHSLIEEYFDAIDQLLGMVRSETGAGAQAGAVQPELGGEERALELCNTIAGLQEVRAQLQ